MYRNRFKNRKVAAKSSTAGTVGDSSVASLSSTAVSTDNDETSNTKGAGRTPPARSKKQQEEFPTEKSFLSPAPSPKQKDKTPSKRAPMKESNASSPLLNVTRRKPRRAQDPELPFFNRILASCGLKFEPEGDDPHILDQEQIFFIRDIQEAIENPENKTKINDFVEQFVSLHDNDSRLLKKSLMPTKRMIENGGCVTSDSLIHLLLEIPQLQNKIFEFLNTKILENVSEDNERLMNEGLNCVQWTKLLLQQLIDLSFIEDAEKMTSKLLECFEYCQSPKTQKEFLQAFPSIIYVGNQQEVAKCLSKVLKESGENTPQLLDALCDIAASQEDRDFITNSVVDMLKNGSRKFMPEVVSFLLAHARYETDKAHIIQQLRQNAELTPFGINDEKLAEDKAMLKKVVAKIGCGLNVLQEVGDLWLNTIANVQNLKPIDVIVLICMVSQGKKKRVLSLVRNRCASGALSEDLIDTTFEHHGQALCEYFDNITEIASYLIKVQDKFISLLGGHWFKLLLLHLEAPYLKQKLLWCLINLLGVNSARVTESVLVTLSNLVSNHMDEVLPLAALLMVPESLLDKVEIVSLEHARKIMDIVCQLAYSGHSQADMLQSDINILIQKQLLSLDTQTKRKGIVGAVMATKHIAADDTNNDTNEEGSDDGDGRGSNTSSEKSLVQLSFHLHPAQNLIEIAFKNTAKSTELRGFLHDELANMLSTSVVSRSFQEWLHSIISSHFEDEYMSCMEELAQTSLPKDVKLATCLNLLEVENQIVVMVGDHVVKDAGKATAVTSTKPQQIAWPAVNMCPLYRLFRLLSYQINNKSFSEMDATLVCPVLTPLNMLQISRAEFASLSNPLEQISILDSLFITVNWFRELISTFCIDTDNETSSEKVLQRLRQTTYLESKILELMPVFPPDYVPPTSQFYTDVIPPKRGAAGKKPKKKRKAKRKKKAPVTQSTLHPALDDADFDVDENDDEDTDFAEEENEPNLIKEYSLKDVCAYFRELDMTILLLLAHDLVIDDEPPAIENPPATFGPAELVFLLEDFSKKLQHSMEQKPGILDSKSSKPFPFGFGGDDKMTSSMKANATLHFHLDLYDTKLIATNSVSPMESICDKLEQVFGFFKDLQEKNDGLKDGPGSGTEKAKLLQKAMFLLISCLKNTLCWSGFYEKDNLDIVHEILKGIAKRTKKKEEMMSTSGIVSLACEYIASFGDFVLALPTAVELIDLLQVINSHDPDQSGELATKNKKLIYTLCVSFMKEEWPPVPKECSSEAQLTVRLIQARHASVDKPITKCVRVLKLLKFISENTDELKAKNGKIASMPLITKASLPSIFKLLSRLLVESARATLSNPPTATQSNDLFDHLNGKWEIILEGLWCMRDIAKVHETKPLFTTFFKESQPILRLFMDSGLPLLEKHYTTRYQEIQILLKKLQNVTKYIQNLCTHGKITNHLGLVSLVPNMRFLLERLVQRVKAMLILNRCSQSFRVGHASNFNLKGEPVPPRIGGSASESDSETEKKASQKRKKMQKSQAGPKSQASTSKAVPGKKAATQKDKERDSTPSSSKKQLKRSVPESDSEGETPSPKMSKQQTASEVVSESDDDEEEQGSRHSSPVSKGKKKVPSPKQQSEVEDEEGSEEELSLVEKRSNRKNPKKKRLFSGSDEEDQPAPSQQKRRLDTSVSSSVTKRVRKIVSSDSE